MPERTLRVFVDAPVDVAGAQARAALPSIEQLLRSSAGRVLELDFDVIASEIGETLGNVLDLLAGLPPAHRDRIGQVTFTLGIDSSGGVSLFAASGTVSARAGLTFTVLPAGGGEHGEHSLSTTR